MADKPNTVNIGELSEEDARLFWEHVISPQQESMQNGPQALQNLYKRLQGQFSSVIESGERETTGSTSS